MAWGFTDIAARYIKAPKTPWNGGLRLVFDLEADALLDAATTVHCICIADLDSDTTAEYGPDQNQISAALEHLARAAALVAHNGQAYDLPVLAKLYGWAPPAGCVVRDTLILARLIFPAVGDLDDIVTGIAKARGGTGIGQLRGRHSIEAWGQRLNLAKVGADLEDFSAWSQELQDRCAADVQICKALWQFLKPDGYSRYAIELEHRAAEVCEAIAAAGVPFDSAGAQRLTDRLRVRRAELRGPLRAQFPGVNLNSNQQLVPLFESRGWKPSKRTEKTGQPKLGDEVLTSIATLYPEFAGLAEYLKLGRLLAFLQTGAAALCKHVGTDRRVRGAIMPLGTPHSRAAHLHPNLAATPNPKKGAAFGAECRSLFHAPSGWVCVAADQSGLQDRGLASYLHPHDGGAYAASFAEGADTHWRSAIALGLVSEGTARDKASAIHTALREGAKRFRYAFLYGVGAEKAGTIIFETCRGVHNAAPEVMARFFAGTATPGESALKRVGRQAIDRFVASTPGLAELRTKLIAHQGKHHWLPGLDGRRVPVRAQHVALNYLITSSEAVITKRWLVRVYDELCERFKYGWDGDVVLALWVHDELVAYAKAKLADQVGEILVRHAREPATFYSFKAPLDADYVVAPSWAGELTMEVEGPPPGTVVLPDEEPTRAKKPRKKKRADAQSELPLDAPAKPQPRTWREDIAAINEAMVAQGVDAAPLSEAVAAFMDPPPEPAPTPKPIKPNGTTASKANGTTPPPPPPDPPSDGGSRSGDPSSVGEGKLYERIHSALRGRGYVRAASFTYRLPDGTVLFTEDRWELRSAFAPTADRPRKEYRYWHVGPKGVAYSGTGPRRIVYNWPAILTAGPGAQVLVVEGAYKAAPLIAAGLLATAAPLHQWSSECVEALAGRHLAYLPDHDHPDANGKRSSERLAADARAKLVPRAASFKIVPARTLWEDLGSAGEPPHGYDVRDWIEAGGTAARLVAICAAIPDGRAGSRLVMVKASSVVARAVPWMWPGHLERGALELLAGAPGLGKSQVQIHYVACATTGRNWPDGAKGGAPRDAIMLTAEDQLASAMVPRLIAAGADLERVHFMQAIRRDAKTDAMFLLGEDIAELEAYLRDHPAAGIVCIDPITAFLGHAKGFDSHRATDVRSQLGPLKDAAERTGVVFSAVTHPPKSAGPNAVDHFIGSQAFIAAARKGHLCVDEMAVSEDGAPRPTGRVFFADAKRNQGKRAPTLVYRVDEVDTGTIDPETNERIRAPVLVWDMPEDLTVEEVLAGARPPSVRSNVPLQAQKFLMEVLAGGPASARKIAIAAAAAGYGIEQLDRLRRKLGIVMFDHVTDGRMWALPEHAPPPDDAGAEGF